MGIDQVVLSYYERIFRNSIRDNRYKHEMVVTSLDMIVLLHGEKKKKNIKEIRDWFKENKPNISLDIVDASLDFLEDQKRIERKKGDYQLTLSEENIINNPIPNLGTLTSLIFAALLLPNYAHSYPEKNINLLQSNVQIENENRKMFTINDTIDNFGYVYYDKNIFIGRVPLYDINGILLETITTGYYFKENGDIHQLSIPQTSGRVVYAVPPPVKYIGTIPSFESFKDSCLFLVCHNNIFVINEKSGDIYTIYKPRDDHPDSPVKKVCTLPNYTNPGIITSFLPWRHGILYTEQIGIANPNKYRITYSGEVNPQIILHYPMVEVERFYIGKLFEMQVLRNPFK